MKIERRSETRGTITFLPVSTKLIRKIAEQNEYLSPARVRQALVKGQRVYTHFSSYKLIMGNGAGA